MTRRATIVVLAALTLTPIAAAQEEAKPKILVSPFGVEIFARLIDQLGMKPLTSADQLGTDRPLDKCVVIVLGSVKPLDGMNLDRLVSGGASLLVATDRDANLSWDEARSVIIHPKGLVNKEPNDVFFGDYHCPWISRNPATPHPIFRNLGDKPVASNCPTFIASVRGDFVQPVAWLPPSTTIEGSRFVVPRQLRFPWTYGVATPGEANQRVLILAGHGLFMNCMTIRDDIGNRKFADNILTWLKAGERTHVLFYHEGVVRTEFKMPLVGGMPDVPLPPITLDIVQRMVGAIQDDGLIQRMIDRGIPPALIQRVFLIVLTVMLFLYGLKKLFGVRVHRPQPGTPYLLGVQPTPRRPLVAQQTREVTERRLFDEPARELARSWFRDVVGIEPGTRLAFDVRAGVPGARRMREQIDSLWRLATGADKGNVDQARLLEIARSLESLGAALERGDFEFSSGETIPSDPANVKHRGRRSELAR